MLQYMTICDRIGRMRVVPVWSPSLNTFSTMTPLDSHHFLQAEI